MINACAVKAKPAKTRSPNAAIWRQNSKREKNRGGILAVTRTVFTAKNTCTDNYRALYCKVRTLRLDFAWEAAIAVDRSGGFGCRLEAPWAVPTSLLGRC